VPGAKRTKNRDWTHSQDGSYRWEREWSESLEDKEKFKEMS